MKTKLKKEKVIIKGKSIKTFKSLVSTIICYNKNKPEYNFV